MKETYTQYVEKYRDKYPPHDIPTTIQIPNGNIGISKYDECVYYYRYIKETDDYEWHRLDGPAFINDYETKWYINDYDVTDEIIVWAKDNDIDLGNLTDEDKALIKLIWSDYGK